MDTTAFDQQFGDLLLMVTVALRSGYTLRQTLETASTFAPEPTASVLKCWLSDLHDGMSYDDAFDRLQEACPSPYLARFVEIIHRHQQVGGNLADMIDPLGAEVRREAGTDKALFPHIRDLCAQVGARVPAYVKEG